MEMALNLLVPVSTKVAGMTLSTYDRMLDASGEEKGRCTVLCFRRSPQAVRQHGLHDACQHG